MTRRDRDRIDDLVTAYAAQALATVLCLLRLTPTGHRQRQLLLWRVALEQLTNLTEDDLGDEAVWDSVLVDRLGELYLAVRAVLPGRRHVRGGAPQEESQR